MPEQLILDGGEDLESGITSTVQMYVRLKNLSALSNLKLQRLKWMSLHTDTEPFNAKLFRQHCQKDIKAIDAGIRTLTANEPLRGNVDVFSFLKIAGWVQYIQHPEVPLSLEIHFDKKVVIQVAADQYRADLREANLGSGHHSFEFAPWKLFLSSQVIEVKAPNGKTIGEYKKRQSTGS